MDDAGGATSFALLPEYEARALLSALDLRLRLLRPPYPALGIGVLRVLRVRECEGVHEIVAGYECYERLAAPAAVVTR